MTSEGALALGLGLGIFAGMGLLFRFIWWVFKLIASYRVFEKMGEPGWKSLIPLYHDYVMYDHVWTGNMGICYIVVELVGTAMANYEGNWFISLVGTILLIVSIVLQAKFAIRLSKAFGHGAGFAVGLFFLEPIFTIILGFGSDTYLGNPSSGEIAGL